MCAPWCTVYMVVSTCFMAPPWSPLSLSCSHSPFTLPPPLSLTLINTLPLSPSLSPCAVAPPNCVCSISHMSGCLHSILVNCPRNSEPRVRPPNGREVPHLCNSVVLHYPYTQLPLLGQPHDHLHHNCSLFQKESQASPPKVAHTHAPPRVLPPR